MQIDRLLPQIRAISRARRWRRRSPRRPCGGASSTDQDVIVLLQQRHGGAARTVNHSGWCGWSERRRLAFRRRRPFRAKTYTAIALAACGVCARKVVRRVILTRRRQRRETGLPARRHERRSSTLTCNRSTTRLNDMIPPASCRSSWRRGRYQIAPRPTCAPDASTTPSSFRTAQNTTHAADQDLLTRMGRNANSSSRAT